MPYDFSGFKKRTEEIVRRFKSETLALRTGRANPALVLNLSIDYHGIKTPLAHLASVSVTDARSIYIEPWEKTTEVIAGIEKAIRESSLGAEPISDKRGVRLILPELSEERRKALLKILSEKSEEAKIALRTARDDVWRNIQKKERQREIAEDDKFRFKEELQKLIEQGYSQIEKIEEQKAGEIRL